MNIEHEVKVARETFLHRPDEFQPMARIDKLDGESIVAIVALSGMDKWRAVALMAKGAVRVVFISDAWMRRLDTPEARAEWERSTKSVREYSDKYEALVVNVIEKATMEVVIMPYFRADGEIMWDPEEIPKNATYLSQGADLVQSVLL